MMNAMDPSKQKAMMHEAMSPVEMCIVSNDYAYEADKQVRDAIKVDLIINLHPTIFYAKIDIKSVGRKNSAG